MAAGGLRANSATCCKPSGSSQPNGLLRRWAVRSAWPSDCRSSVGPVVLAAVEDTGCGFGWPSDRQMSRSRHAPGCWPAISRTPERNCANVRTSSKASFGQTCVRGLSNRVIGGRVKRVVTPVVMLVSAEGGMLVSHSHPAYLRLSSDATKSLLAAHVSGKTPRWFEHLALTQWGIDLIGLPAFAALTVRRQESPYVFASWELNHLCNYGCPHCYLDSRPNRSATLASRIEILDAMEALGVYRLQITGGEPLIDRYFVETYREAYHRGMVLTVSTNGSRIGHAEVLDVFTSRPPLRVVVSLYGATSSTYEAVTRTPRGTFGRFCSGLRRAVDAGINIRINSIVTRLNQHERHAMEVLARSFTSDVYQYDKISPTVSGGDSPLLEQADFSTRTSPRPFDGCSAGAEFFHVDPQGRASMCKLSRSFSVQLSTDYTDKMSDLAAEARASLSRHGRCAGCTVSELCSTCPILVENYRTAGAASAIYCEVERR